MSAIPAVVGGGRIAGRWVGIAFMGLFPAIGVANVVSEPTAWTIGITALLLMIPLAFLPRTVRETFAQWSCGTPRLHLPASPAPGRALAVRVAFDRLPAEVDEIELELACVRVRECDANEDPDRNFVWTLPVAARVERDGNGCTIRATFEVPASLPGTLAPYAPSAPSAKGERLAFEWKLLLVGRDRPCVLDNEFRFAMGRGISSADAEKLAPGDVEPQEALFYTRRRRSR